VGEGAVFALEGDDVGDGAECGEGGGFERKFLNSSETFGLPEFTWPMAQASLKATRAPQRWGWIGDR